MGILLLLCGLYCVYSAARGLSSGSAEDIDDFPPVKKRKNPINFYVYICTCMAGGLAMILLSVIMLVVQFVK